MSKLLVLNKYFISNVVRSINHFIYINCKIDNKFKNVIFIFNQDYATVYGGFKNTSFTHREHLHKQKV